MRYLKTVSLGLFIFFVILNFCQPLMTDDFFKSNGIPLVNHSIISLLETYYRSWSGRVGAYFLGCIFFNKPYNFISIPILNLLNAAFFVFFYNYMFKIIYHNRIKESLSHTLFFLLTLTSSITLSALLKNSLWKTTAIEHFWPLCLIILCFESFFISKNSSKIPSFLFFLPGFFIGLADEILFATLLSIYISSWFYLILFKYNILDEIKDKCVTYFMTGLGIGGIILIAAPGNYIRTANLDKGIHYSLWDKILIWCHNFKHAYRIDLLLFIFLVSLLLLFVLGIINKNNFKLYLLKIIFIVCSLIIFIPISEFGFESDRIFIISSVILFYCSYTNFLDALPKINLIKNRLFPWFGDVKLNLVLSILLIGVLFLNLRAYYRLFLFSQHRENEIVMFKKQGEKNPVFESWKPHKIDKILVCFADINIDVNSWENTNYKTYYDFESVKTK